MIQNPIMSFFSLCYSSFASMRYFYYKIQFLSNDIIFIACTVHEPFNVFQMQYNLCTSFYYYRDNVGRVNCVVLLKLMGQPFAFMNNDSIRVNTVHLFDNILS
jgi:hypothetical protein